MVIIIKDAQGLAGQFESEFDLKVIGDGKPTGENTEHLNRFAFDIGYNSRAIFRRTAHFSQDSFAFEI
jgi:hypothetical protein